MIERPIIFNAPTIPALLAGTKTQTRRLVKPQPDRPRFGSRHVLALDDEGIELYLHSPMLPRAIRHRYGKPGDLLWVREAWRIGAWNEDEGTFAIDYRDGPRRQRVADPGDHDGERFNALWVECCDELAAKGIKPGRDGRYRWAPGESPLRWRASLHMPRWASRIALEVTGVRVERLHAISGADAIAEGWPPDGGDPFAWYRGLWAEIHGPDSWATNPWVWVIDFKRIEARA